MSFSDGDFIKVEYSAWRASDGSMVYTTQREIAEKNGIYNKDRTYKPAIVIIGKHTVVKGLEDAIRNMNVGESKKVEIEPEDAFGQRNPDLVRVMHASDFRKRDIDPVPGLQVDLDGTPAVITAVNSGRVTIDANHPLAGEKMTYEIKVVSKIESDREKVEELVNASGIKADSIKFENGVAELHFGESADRNAADYFISKNAAVRAILDFIPKANKVTVVEEYTRGQKDKKQD
ncbi:MAG: peptidylprolyl isomerase [Candidatus Micrarchaeaceae archaeon]